MIRYLRIFLIAAGLALAVAAAAYFARWEWAIAFWPWPDGRLSYIFLASIMAAAAASLLYVGISGELHAAAPGALNLLVSTGGSSLAFLWLYRADPDNPLLLLTALALFFLALFNLGLFLWTRSLPLIDTRPAGWLVRISFAAFAFFLAAASILLVFRYPTIFPWPLDPRSSLIFGLIFAGNFVYFTYFYLEPYRVMALGQLWGFLAYDLVLIIPFLQHISAVRPEHRISLVIYLFVLISSAVVAVWTLFPRPPVEN